MSSVAARMLALLPGYTRRETQCFRSSGCRTSPPNCSMNARALTHAVAPKRFRLKTG